MKNKHLVPLEERVEDAQESLEELKATIPPSVFSKVKERLDAIQRTLNEVDAELYSASILSDTPDEQFDSLT